MYYPGLFSTGSGYISYLFVIVVTMIIGFATQAYIKHSYKKHAQVSNGVGLTGAQFARRMLDANGLHNVSINCVSGSLTDHYDPRNQTVNLSQDIYNSTSVSAAAVACHECGHAVQHAEGYMPMKARSALVPVVNFGSSIWLILLLIGIFLNISGLIYVAIAVYAIAVLFQLVTLPVEFNASSRATAYLNGGCGLYLNDEVTSGAKTVLRAAALTYVASALTSILQLLYYLQFLNRNN